MTIADRLDGMVFYGSDDPPAERIELCAGPLSMAFEPGTGFLRYIRMGDREVLRGIYAAVRDHNWGTIEPDITDLSHEGSANAFRLTFEATCGEREVDFVWKGTICGSESGEVVFAMEGRARSSFRRNRIGFCVLHPASAAGTACRIDHLDGESEDGVLPEPIAPHQPFRDMRAISHEVMPGIWADVQFEGDVFEMEDQRNWTDASYKTYCTPLELPYPVEIAEGTEVRQTVRLSIKGDASPRGPAVVPRPGGVVYTVQDGPAAALPRIGLGSASHGQPLSAQEIARLKQIGPGHLRVDLWMGVEGWREALRRASIEADALGVGLEAALYLGDAPEDALRALRGALDDESPRITRWLIFDSGTRHTEERLVLLARKHLGASSPNAIFGGGTDAYFTELNRQRPATESLDLVCYSLNPQVHAFDNASIVETLEVQATTVRSARGFAAGLPVAVSAVTLQPRFNPNATGEAADLGPDVLPPEVDVRQMSLLGAGWTLGSIKYLSESGAASVTYYETTGWRGVMEVEEGAPIPAAFPSNPGAVFPLYHVLADVGEFAEGHVLLSRSSSPLDVDGLVLQSGSRIRILLANLSSEEQRVSVGCDALGTRAQIKRLDGDNARHAMRNPETYRKEPGSPEPVTDGRIDLRLPPYGLARIDCGEENDG